MARLLGGIGIYLAVLLGLFCASPSGAMEPSWGDMASAASLGDVHRSDAQAFDLESMPLKQKERHLASGGQGVDLDLPQDADIGSEAVQLAARRRIRGPAFNYRVADGWPVIELGMLGGTVRPKQRLAHLALEWDF